MLGFPNDGKAARQSELVDCIFTNLSSIGISALSLSVIPSVTQNSRIKAIRGFLVLHWFLIPDLPVRALVQRISGILQIPGPHRPMVFSPSVLLWVEIAVQWFGVLPQCGERY